MASAVTKSAAFKEDDDEEDLEALRKAALMTMRKKSPPKHPKANAIFKPHFGNPNLIAIIPEGAEPVVHKKQGPRPSFFRHPPPWPRLQNTASSISTALKVLPQVQIEINTSQEKNDKGSKKEEVSTKFSRFDDSKSESEEESETENKESESSEESDDVLALDDDDDSLEALMAQMEQEIEGSGKVDSNKKEKKKAKNNKCKEKDSKKEEKNVVERLKNETKTAVVEPTLKEAGEIRVAKFEENSRIKSLSPKPKIDSPVKIYPLKTASLTNDKTHSLSPKIKSPIAIAKSPVRQQIRSPQRRSLTPTNYSQRDRSPSRLCTVTKTKSPLRQRSRSPRSSIVRSYSPRTKEPSPLLRHRSPRNVSPDRRSPLRNSPHRQRSYIGNKSLSPHNKLRDCGIKDRSSRSPVRRRSLSPRRGQRQSPPRYYRRRSRSPCHLGNRPSPLRSPHRYRSRSPIRRSPSPRNKKYTKSYPHSPPYWGTLKRRSPTLSPRRSKSPCFRSKSPRKREYSPRRRQASPRREYVYRRNSVSPKRKPSPPYKKYSPPRSPRLKQRSLSPRRNVSPRRRVSPPAVKESRSKPNRRSRTPSLSLSPSPQRETKEPTRRYKSPLRPRKASNENVNNRPILGRKNHSPESKGQDSKDRRKPNKECERERDNKQWDRNSDDRRRERQEKTERERESTKDNKRVRERENSKTDKSKNEEPNEETAGLRVTDNPVFEARRRKFESNVVVEPASKKIRLLNKKNSPVEEKKIVEEKKVEVVKENKIVENSVHSEEDILSGREEIDEIDSFLNEDVLDLSAEVWDSDEDLLPKMNKNVPKVLSKEKSPVKKPAVKKKTSSKEKEKSTKPVAEKVSSKPSKKTKLKNKPTNPTETESSPSPVKKSQRSSEQEEERRDRDDSDLRAELSRRREERLTKAGSLHEKLPARLLQSAFESALGTKKTKKEEKPQKSQKESKSSETLSPPPVRKEKIDGRRVLVLKRPAPVKMQSAHINVTFPKDSGSDSESSYSSSSSDEQYVAPTKRKLPVYMRLGSATQHKRPSGRKVNLRSRRSQV